MAIDILRDHAIKAMPENVAQARRATTQQAKAEVRPVSVPSAPSIDDVVFTEKAKTLSKAADIAKRSDGIDYDKVAALKQQFENGTLEFDFERVAEKMIASENSLASIF